MITVEPLNGTLRGDNGSGGSTTWVVPGSKSITNRALILAALKKGKTILKGVLHSDDTKHMRNALTSLGIEISQTGDFTLEVIGGIDKLKVPENDLFIGNSGTSVRFLLALACLVPGEVNLVGDEHMAKRPLGHLLDGLKQMGVEVDCPTGCPPVKIKGTGNFPGGKVTMPGNKSSQYFSALMLTGAFGPTDLKIQVEGTLVSLPYVEMTIKMVKDFGGSIEHDKISNSFLIKGHCTTADSEQVQQFKDKEYVIEPDASSASYPFAFAAATGSSIKVPDLNDQSMQGDFGFTKILEQIGCTVKIDEDGTTVSGPKDGKSLDGIKVDMHHISDTVMTLAAIAPLCKGPVEIINVANIRIKETDRLIATVNELKRLGQQVEHGDDWLKITPGKPITPAEIECYADHRMAMSFGILGTKVPGITIKDPDCTAKTYPNFFKDLNKICHGASQNEEPLNKKVKN